MLKERKEKITNILKELNFKEEVVDEHITKCSRKFNNNKIIVIYLNDIVNRKINEFDDFEFNEYILIDENGKEVDCSRNLYELLLNM